MSETGAKKWTFNFSFGGRRSWMGLGGYPAVSLIEAREARDRWRKVLQSGQNPIEARREAKKIAAGKPTFGRCADEFLAAKASEWRNEKHRAQWRMTLAEYAKSLRFLPVDEVDTASVLAVLQPVWQSRPETGARLRGRIEAVLDYAKAHGWRSGENPAAWRGHLALILPKRGKLSRGHHAAMDYRDMSAFVAQLPEAETGAALALEFLILTAARSGEAHGAKWSEIDLENKVWIVPAERMKAGREHRVPLSGRALAILDRLAQMKSGEFVFPGQRATKSLSGMALERLGLMPHGDAEQLLVHTAGRAGLTGVEIVRTIRSAANRGRPAHDHNRRNR